MEEKERYGCRYIRGEFDVFIDNETDKYLTIQEVKYLLNQQDKRISELKQQLAESEKSKEINIKERDKICLEMATDYNRQIIDLQSQLAITEKALELACETIKQMCGKPLWIGGNIPSPEPKDSKYFKDIAKEMLENEQIK